MLKQRAESDAASTFAESCASEGATSDEEEDDQPSLLRRVFADQLVTVAPESSLLVVKNTFIDIAPASTCGNARRRAQSEPRCMREMGAAAWSAHAPQSTP